MLLTIYNIYVSLSIKRNHDFKQSHCIKVDWKCLIQVVKKYNLSTKEIFLLCTNITMHMHCFMAVFLNSSPRDTPPRMSQILLYLTHKVPDLLTVTIGNKHSDRWVPRTTVEKHCFMGWNSLALLVKQVKQPGGLLAEETDAANVVRVVNSVPCDSLCHVLLLKHNARMSRRTLSYKHSRPPWLQETSMYNSDVITHLFEGKYALIAVIL